MELENFQMFLRVVLFSSAWSNLAETEEPTVLTANFRNRKEPEPKFWQNWNPFKNRNRLLKPRVTETAIFGGFHVKYASNFAKNIHFG